jgi:rare lipoprotein A
MGILTKSLTVATSLIMCVSFPVSAHPRVLSASYYADSFQGKRMANGAVFSQNSNSVASNKFKLGTRVNICYRGKCIGGVVRDRCGSCGIDLSKSVFRQLAPLRKGRIKVTVYH